MWLILVTTLVWLLYKWWTEPYSYWKKRGFPSLKASFPFGTSPDLTLLRRFQGTVLTELCEDMKDEPYAGLVVMRRPFLLLKDPDIIKRVLQQDFAHFAERIFADVLLNDPVHRNLFNQKGELWRGFRIQLTPFFTSGKIKNMFGLFEETCQEMSEVIETRLGTDVEAKDLMTRFATDLISSCAFGFKTSTLKEDHNDYFSMCHLIFPTNFSVKRKIKILFNAVFPRFEKLLKFSYASRRLSKYWTNLILDTLRKRQENDIRRNDFIDTLLELKAKGILKIETGRNVKGEVSFKNYEIMDEDLVGQAFSFLVGGFETSSTVLAAAVYELALHEDIQERIREEIESTCLRQGSITYQTVQKMTYLEQVVNETLRKYPLAPYYSRKCTRNYRMPGRPDRLLEEGMRVIIPVFKLHRDPNYFPEPDNFNPDRFSPENRGSIPPFAYLPFGEGPRICIGLRFGMLQIKMAILFLLKSYRILPCEKTPEKLEFMPSTLVTLFRDPIYVRFERLEAAKG